MLVLVAVAGCSGNSDSKPTASTDEPTQEPVPTAVVEPTEIL